MSRILLEESLIVLLIHLWSWMIMHLRRRGGGLFLHRQHPESSCLRRGIQRKRHGVAYLINTLSLLKWRGYYSLLVGVNSLCSIVIDIQRAVMIRVLWFIITLREYIAPSSLGASKELRHIGLTYDRLMIRSLELRARIKVKGLAQVVLVFLTNSFYILYFSWFSICFVFECLLQIVCSPTRRILHNMSRTILENNRTTKIIMKKIIILSVVYYLNNEILLDDSMRNCVRNLCIQSNTTQETLQ